MATSVLSRLESSTPISVASTAVLGLSLAGLTLYFFGISRNPLPSSLPSPRITVLPKLTPAQQSALPYPPDLYPGARDIDTPYGSIRTYEFGPEGGNKVLFIHGISTPCASLRDVAYGLVDRGCRVLLYDLYGRGYSDAPLVSYDDRLYTSQILLVLTSACPSWTSKPVDIIGYSLGGALAVSFASYNPHLVRRLLLIAPGGLLYKSRIDFAVKVAYLEWWPDWIIALFASWRLKPANMAARKGGECASNRAEAVPSHAIADWQARNHIGFIYAFVSSFRKAPLFDQIDSWKKVRGFVESGQLGVKEDEDKICIVFGENDAVIKPTEMIPRVLDCLGQENVRVTVVKGAEHDSPAKKGAELAKILGDFMKLKGINGM